MSCPRPHRSVARTTLLSFALACGSGNEPSTSAATKPADGGPAAASSAPAAASGAPAAASGTPATASGAPGEGTPHVVKLSDEELERLRLMGAEVHEHLQTAEGAVAAGAWEAAAKAYAKALELDDDNPHILGAMGWAEFNNHRLEQAQRLVRQALRYERDAQRRAHLLYSLGRIEEEAGNYVSAKEHFDHSLRLKDDAETKTHDDAVAEKASEACRAGACDKPDYVDLDAACKAMLERVHEQLGLPVGSANDEFSCDPSQAQKVALEGGDATEATILKVSGEHGVVEEEEYDLLAHIEGGWHWVGTILDVENPHRDGILRSGSIASFEARELMPESAGSEILIKLELSESDADLDENMMYHDEHEAYVVCGIQKNRHVCHEVPTRMLWEAEAIDPNRPTAHETTKHEFTANAEFDGKGKVTVSGTGEVPEEEKGTHAISELPEPHGFLFLHED